MMKKIHYTKNRNGNVIVVIIILGLFENCILFYLVQMKHKIVFTIKGCNNEEIT